MEPMEGFHGCSVSSRLDRDTKARVAVAPKAAHLFDATHVTRQQRAHRKRIGCVGECHALGLHVQSRQLHLGNHPARRISNPK